jgi:hypothetical protein
MGGDGFVGALFEFALPMRRDGKDRDLAAASRQPPAVPDGGTQPLQSVADRGVEQHGVEWSFETPFIVGQPEELRTPCAVAGCDGRIEAPLVPVELVR